MPSSAAAHEHQHTDANEPVTELRLKVGGMHCASCAANVQRAIASQPGVQSAAVSLGEGQAVIEGRNLDPDAVIHAVRSHGYEADAVREVASPQTQRSEIELRQHAHERQWRRRAIAGLGLWAPLEALHWIAHGAGWHGLGLDGVLFAGATIVMAVAGGGFYRSAWRAAVRGTTNMDTLIAVGATTAYVFSIVIFASRLLGRPIDQPLYFAEAAALLGIISLGHWLEARAAARAGSAVRELLELQPDEAELIGPRQRRLEFPSPAAASTVIPSADVRPGDLLQIRPGARVPVDGVVVEGESDVDESVMTGESLPVARRAGDAIVAGAMNTTGRLLIRATVDGRHTTVARIADLVSLAQSSRTQVQRLADRVSAIFVPAVMVIALATFLGWWLIGHDLAAAAIATTTVLIISCPCALGLATPMAVMVGTGAASRAGILIKNAAAMELAGRATMAIFDKTGTLTRNLPVVTAVSPEDRGVVPDDLLALAASAEAASEHPIGRAIVNAARARRLELRSATDFRSIPGEGVSATVDGSFIEVRRDDRSSCRVLRDGRPVGRIDVRDEIRPDARPSIERLRGMGLRVALLTGDSEAAALEVARPLAIDPADVRARAAPAGKAAFVRDLACRETVIMVGDGVNDAAALVEAQVGVAMASGTNIAIESADIVIPGEHVDAVSRTVHIGRRTLRTIRQNLFFAFFYNVLAIPLAALGMLGLYGPLIAAAAMGVSDMTVIGNAIRLKRSLRRNLG